MPGGMASQPRRNAPESPARRAGRVAETSFRVAAASGIGLVCVACSGSSGELSERVAPAEQAISGGLLDPEGAAVVGIQSPGHAICSGALIAPDVVLTARHCVSDVYGTPMSNQDLCKVSTYGPLRLAESVYVTTAATFPPALSAYHRVREVIGLPSENSYLCGNDMAILLLEEPLDETEAVAFVPRVDTSIEKGEEYAASGYGGTDSAGAGAGVRRRRDGLLAACVGAGCPAPEPPSYVEIKETEWRGDVGTCPGDSGGPAIDREGRVAGVLSRGEAGCSTSIFSDVASWGPWIKQTTAYAAGVAGYEAPAWTKGWPTDPVVEPEDEGASASCSAARGAQADDREGRTAQTVGAAIAAVALFHWRRRSRSERRSGRPNGA